jgi:hypothetical protein
VKLLEILKMTQKDLMLKLPKYLIEKGYEPTRLTVTKDYIYAQGNVPIMLVAHLDTVHDALPTDKTMRIADGVLTSPETGLGADDRAGVYSILQLLDSKPFILFTTDEEKGCLGAIAAACKINSPKIKYIVELDRRGKNDCVFYGCNNFEFINYIEKHGFKFAKGTSSDVRHLGSACSKSIQASAFLARPPGGYEQIVNTICSASKHA